ncbi:MAG: hypothetical protein K2V38_27690 [Gemmataceae bacterium]|nr:hypothetical protein [Gemmataceae bacterium]
MDPVYFPHESVGRVQFDPGLNTRAFEPWWVLLTCDPGIVDYYAWLLRRHGVAIHKGSAFGPHVSVVKGEEPPEKGAWGVDPGPLAFRYSNVVRWDNGRHAWLDVWSPDLADLRARLGFGGPPKMSFHLTLGRMVFPKAGAPPSEPGELIL